MNIFDLSISDLLIWGIVLHLIADWPLQNDWMANNKANRNDRYWFTHPAHEGAAIVPSRWWDRHPAAYVHASIHGVLLMLIFGWVAAPLAFVHLLIDTRIPVVWWSKLIKQTQPQNQSIIEPIYDSRGYQVKDDIQKIPLYDVGLEVRFWTDQVFHIICIAIAALLVGI